MLVSSVCLGTVVFGAADHESFASRIARQVLPDNSMKVMLGSHCVVDSISALTRGMVFCLRVQLIA